MLKCFLKISPPDLLIIVWLCYVGRFKIQHEYYWLCYGRFVDGHLRCVRSQEGYVGRYYFSGFYELFIYFSRSLSFRGWLWWRSIVWSAIVRGSSAIVRGSSAIVRGSSAIVWRVVVWSVIL